MMRPLVIVGAGGHARACIDVIERHGGYEIVGLIGRTEEVGRNVFQHRVIGSDDALPALAGHGVCAIVTVGQIRTSQARRTLFEQLRQLGFEQPAIVSPLAYVSSRATIGAGTIVMHHATVNIGAKVGCNCIVNTGAIVEHDCHVGDHCHISTGTVLNGGVRVGSDCFVGSGSVIREERSVSYNSVIGMGLSVRHDVLPGTIYTG
jgi:sugar O-acyltransferase (sialic acid O-acetyltransferase NeuD family)